MRWQMLTAGNVRDVKAAPALLERSSRMRYLLADKDYDADRHKLAANFLSDVAIATVRAFRF